MGEFVGGREEFVGREGKGREGGEWGIGRGVCGSSSS